MRLNHISDKQSNFTPRERGRENGFLRRLLNDPAAYVAGQFSHFCLYSRTFTLSTIHSPSSRSPAPAGLLPLYSIPVTKSFPRRTFAQIHTPFPTIYPVPKVSSHFPISVPHPTHPTERRSKLHGKRPHPIHPAHAPIHLVMQLMVAACRPIQSLT